MIKSMFKKKKGNLKRKIRNLNRRSKWSSRVRGLIIEKATLTCNSLVWLCHSCDTVTDKPHCPECFKKLDFEKDRRDFKKSP